MQENIFYEKVGSHISAQWAQDFTSRGKDPCQRLYLVDLYLIGRDLYLIGTKLYLIGTDLYLIGTYLYLNSTK